MPVGAAHQNASQSQASANTARPQQPPIQPASAGAPLDRQREQSQKEKPPEGGLSHGISRSTDHQNVAYSAIRIATTPTAPMLKLGGVP